MQSQRSFRLVCSSITLLLETKFEQAIVKASWRGKQVTCEHTRCPQASATSLFPPLRSSPSHSTTIQWELFNWCSVFLQNKKLHRQTRRAMSYFSHKNGIGFLTSLMLNQCLPFHRRTEDFQEYAAHLMAQPRNSTLLDIVEEFLFSFSLLYFCNNMSCT